MDTALGGAVTATQPGSHRRPRAGTRGHRVMSGRQRSAQSERGSPLHSRPALSPSPPARYDAQIYTNDAQKLGEELRRDVREHSALETGHEMECDRHTACLPVSMTDSRHLNSGHCIVDCVHYAGSHHTDAPLLIAAFQLLAARRPGIGGRDFPGAERCARSIGWAASLVLSPHWRSVRHGS